MNPDLFDKIAPYHWMKDVAVAWMFISGGLVAVCSKLAVWLPPPHRTSGAYYNAYETISRISVGKRRRWAVHEHGTRKRGAAPTAPLDSTE